MHLFSECMNKPFDIYIVADKSVSIEIEDLDIEREAIRRVYNSFDIGAGKTRVGLISYNTEAETEFTLSSYNSAGSINSASIVQVYIFSHHASLTRQAFLVTPIHVYRSKAAKMITPSYLIIICKVIAPIAGENIDISHSSVDQCKYQSKGQIGRYKNTIFVS